MSNTLYPCLWFNGQAKEAADFYCSVFKDARITAHMGMLVTFELMGQKFMGLDAGPHFTFNEAVSFVVSCKNQEEIDYYRSGLSGNGGQESMCGWLKDKCGLSWQVVPEKMLSL